MSTSMLYTMGTALNRAAENGCKVSLLVEGHWIDGQVAASDGIGVVVESDDGLHCVVRTERISAVRLHSASPYQTPLTTGDEEQAPASAPTTPVPDVPAPARRPPPAPADARPPSLRHGLSDRVRTLRPAGPPLPPPARRWR